MTKTLRKWLFASLLGATACIGKAELQWPTPEIQLYVSAGTAEVAVAFPFQNSGPEPVTFSGLRTDCGCTTAETAQSTYAPGESGHVEVRFHPGNRIGALERTIEARTSAGSTTRLKLRVQISEAVSASPRELTWEIGRPPHEQAVELVAKEGPEIVEIGIHDATEDTLDVRVIPLASGRRYRLEVIPRSAEASFDISFSCRVRLADGAEQNLPIRAVVGKMK